MEQKLTLLDALNNYLGLPKYIRVGNRTIVQTARKRILNGEVKVNEFTVIEPEQQLKSGDYIRFGCARYNRDSFYVRF